MIYTDYDLLDLVYKQIIMRIPEPEADHAERAKAGSAGKQAARSQLASSAASTNYLPSAEEIKLAARAFASMPFQTLKRKNPILNLEGQYLETLFSITGYFTALSKIIENGYGSNPVQAPIPATGNPALTRELREKQEHDRSLAR